ncbi:Isopentenyldiphosphate isomerase [Pisolithus albus]|nr:Isopentenyldiphosphate isomerase [Pisolithus albus]
MSSSVLLHIILPLRASPSHRTRLFNSSNCWTLAPTSLVSSLTCSTPIYSPAMSSPAILAARAALASIDLSKYDPEQSRLMDERCILVDEQDNAIGAMDKKTCHLMENINKGLLHRAFSAFVFRPSDGKLLLQQRASSKITFPDMWTNTCCSHPLDDFEEEKVEKDQSGVRHAASRKLEHELGIPRSQTPVDQFQYLTRIHYLAPSNDTWGEHEVDYILFLTADVTVTPNLNEIREYKWVDKVELQNMFEDSANSFTPWFKLIARDFLFGWWDELLRRRGNGGLLDAKSLAGIADGSKVIKM